MLKLATHARAQAGASVSIPEVIRRAIAELTSVRSGIEDAFEVVHAQATCQALENPHYLVAMQSIDSLSQQVEAIEQFLRNLSDEFSDDVLIERARVSAGVTLAAVAARLTADTSGVDQDAGDCDFF